MNSKIYVTALVSVLVAVLLIGGVAIPLMDSASKETITIENENPQWIRMAYLTDQSDYQVSYTVSGDTVTVTNGDDNQSGALTDTILYADDKTSVMVSDGDIILVGEDDDTIGYKQLTAPFIIERTGGVLSVTDANDTTTFIDSRTWAYVPLSTEKYGVFSTGDLNRYESALACAGAYAGVYCYNEYVTEDVGLVMDADVTNDYITSVKWALESDNNAKSKTIFPFVPEEKILDPGSLVTVKSAPPTPTYTDGNWGYDLSGSDATIVSYSGATGGILTVPATVGGYNVVAVGNGAKAIIDTDSPFTDIVITDGITIISAYAFGYCQYITGTLTIPDSVTSIGNSAFRNVTITGSLTIPDSVTSIGKFAFSGCYGLNGTLTLSNNLTTIENNTFQDCHALTGTLTIPDGVTSIGNQAFEACTHITGTLTIPDGVTSIGSRAFYGMVGLTGTLTIPDSVTSLGNNAFYNCSNIDKLIVLSDATPGTTTFSMAGVKEVLDLSAVEYTTTSYGLTADSVQDHIDADSYLCVTEVSETIQREGAVIDVFLVIPVVMIAGAVLMAVRYFIRK